MKHKYKLAFMNMAERFGQTSEAKRLKVGSLLVRGDKILSQGVNGQPPGWHTEVCEGDDGQTLPTVRHAEIACLEKLWASSETATGATMFISHKPCIGCAIKLVTAGIVKVYWRHEYRLNDGVEHLEANGVEVERI